MIAVSLLGWILIALVVVLALLFVLLGFLLHTLSRACSWPGWD